MTKPDFIAQTAEPMSDDEIDIWTTERFDEIRAKGATFIKRAINRDYIPVIVLIEGWIEKPKKIPEPHFQIVELKPISEIK